MTTPAPARQPPRDPGRQPERTALSWRRTLLAATVAALLAARMGVAQPTPVALVAVAAVAAGWLAILVLATRRMTAMAAAEPGPVNWAVPLTTLVTAVYAGLGVVLVAAM